MKILSILFFALLSGLSAQAQQLDTTIPSKEGRIFVIPPGPGYEIDHIHLDSMHITIKSENAKPAHVMIHDGTETTLIYADTIYVEPTLDNFTLTGNARIEQNENILQGPIKIQFTSRDNLMVLEGSSDRPAKYEYTLDNGMKAFSTGEVFHLHFVEVNGKRSLKSVKSVRDHQGSQIFPDAQVMEKTMKRKMSAPN